MNNIETYNIKERFPVGDRGVVLLEYPTLPKRFAVCLYDQSNPDELLGRVSETSEQAAYRIYLERCDTLVEQHEQKTGLQFPLPSSCMVVLTPTGDLVNIRRGMTGYFPSDWNAPGDRKRNEETATFQNAQHELTKAQCAAMVCGSMFGWDVPGANPAMYDENGHAGGLEHILPQVFLKRHAGGFGHDLRQQVISAVGRGVNLCVVDFDFGLGFFDRLTL